MRAAPSAKQSGGLVSRCWSEQSERDCEESGCAKHSRSIPATSSNRKGGLSTAFFHKKKIDSVRAAPTVKQSGRTGGRCQSGHSPESMVKYRNGQLQKKPEKSILRGITGEKSK